MVGAVGKTGFEPATPWSQTRCATGLRYFPNLSGAPQTAGLFPELELGCKCTIWPVTEQIKPLFWVKPVNPF